MKQAPPAPPVAYQPPGPPTPWLALAVLFVVGVVVADIVRPKKTTR